MKYIGLLFPCFVFKVQFCVFADEFFYVYMTYVIYDFLPICCLVFPSHKKCKPYETPQTTQKRQTMTELLLPLPLPPRPKLMLLNANTTDYLTTTYEIDHAWHRAQGHVYIWTQELDRLGSRQLTGHEPFRTPLKGKYEPFRTPLKGRKNAKRVPTKMIPRKRLASVAEDEEGGLRAKRQCVDV